MRGVVPEALARRKLVKGDFGSEGSETANSGNDEQREEVTNPCLPTIRKLLHFFTNRFICERKENNPVNCFLEEKEHSSVRTVV